MVRPTMTRSSATRTRTCSVRQAGQSNRHPALPESRAASLAISLAHPVRLGLVMSEVLSK